MTRSLSKLVLLAASVLFVGLAAEGLLRWAGSREPPSEPRPWMPEGLPELRGVLELGKPNARGVYHGAFHQTNSAGFRGRELPKAKPPGTWRIALIGDSVTMGAGVSADQTYAFQLEQRLNSDGGSPRFEVMNLGLAGLNLERSLKDRLRRIGLRFAPDLIVYGFTLNDVEGRHYRETAARTADTWRPSGGGSHVVLLLRARWLHLLELTRPQPGSYTFELDDNYFRNPAAWSAFEKQLDALAKIGRARGVCVGVLLHTKLFALNSFHPFQRHYDAVATAAETRGLQVIRSLPAFQGRRAESLWVAPTDTHPNAEAHRILAEVLHEGLRALPEECRLP